MIHLIFRVTRVEFLRSDDSHGQIGRKLNLMTHSSVNVKGKKRTLLFPQRSQNESIHQRLLS